MCQLVICKLPQNCQMPVLKSAKNLFMLLSSSSHLVFYRAGSVRGLVQINVMGKHKIVKDSDTSLMQGLHKALLLSQARMPEGACWKCCCNSPVFFFFNSFSSVWCNTKFQRKQEPVFIRNSLWKEIWSRYVCKVSIHRWRWALRCMLVHMEVYSDFRGQFPFL